MPDELSGEPEPILNRGIVTINGRPSTTSTSRKALTGDDVMFLYAMSVSDIQVANEKGAAEENRTIDTNYGVNNVYVTEAVNSESGEAEFPLDRANSCCSSILSIRCSVLILCCSLHHSPKDLSFQQSSTIRHLATIRLVPRDD